MQIRNPRTGLYDYTINIPSANEIKDLCNDLKVNQSSWSKQTIEYRINILQLWKQEVSNFKQELIAALANDTGRINETILEVDLVATSIDRWCSIVKEFFKEEAIKQSSIPFIQLQQQVVAIGLVGVVSPWNFPLLLSLIDTIPALLSGCAVIVKPSEITPRFIDVIKKTIIAVPQLQQVFAYVQGEGSVGEAIVNNSDLVCFTGSTSTGKKVYDAASKNMIPVFLELGGKDAAIVCNGADIQRAAASILWGSTVNAGQSCLSIERVYVQQTIYKQFLDAIVTLAKRVELNNEDISKGQIGPIIFEKQATIINAQLQDAIENGAVIEFGNASCSEINGGFYCKPTIVTNVNHSMKLLQEETFGPIIPIMPFNTIDEGIALANDSIYGLSGAVFAETNEQAIEIANHLIGGAISINDCALTAIMHEGEKNSFKLSGIGGTRMGPNAIKRFMKQRVLIINNNLQTNSPWWFK